MNDSTYQADPIHSYMYGVVLRREREAVLSITDTVWLSQLMAQTIMSGIAI